MTFLKVQGASHLLITQLDVNITTIAHEKKLAAEAAADLVESGMKIGLGTGSTVAELLPAIARRHIKLRCVSSSPRTEQAALKLGLQVEPFIEIDQLDLVIDGADQIAPDGWLLKGGGAAHTREKILAAATDRFVVIADSRKLVPALSGSIPVELLAFGIKATLRQLQPIRLRDVPLSPDGGVIADYQLDSLGADHQGFWSNPAQLATWLEQIPGLVSHGLFPPSLLAEVYVGIGNRVERWVIKPHAASA